MKSAVILAAGEGRKMWPYADTRSKTMIQVSNLPVVAYNIRHLLEMGFDDVVIVAAGFAAEIRHYFAGTPGVRILQEAAPKGTAFSAAAGIAEAKNDSFLLLYGDTILQGEDIRRLIDAPAAPAALAAPITEQVQNYICCTIEGGTVQNIQGHPREGGTHFFAGFKLDKTILPVLQNNSGRFTNIQVGCMAPQEGYLEMSLADAIAAGQPVAAVEAQGEVFDLDKPWHILQANRSINRQKCAQLTQNELAEGAEISPGAILHGFVKLGKNSKIGPNVRVNGNAIVGDNTLIDNGAILNGNIVAGDGCTLTNYCFVEEDTTIGDGCVLNHCAELAGMAMPGAYLYHYMEFFGILGENADLGAATVCGSLRFDDGETAHKVLGRRETPLGYANACYIGDYCRTGVNAILMPGTKMGSRSVLGAGAVLAEDLPSNTLAHTKQQLTYAPWNSDKYGW